jgi:hypothetical protein
MGFSKPAPTTGYPSRTLDAEIGMSPRVALSLAVIVSALSTGAVHAAPRAVIELFTSQGCSSCPPADQLAGELARDPSIIVMSLPIDYWDYLGWKDTLALPGHTKRQRAYARTRGDREVYTPQVVVNGSVHVLGSDKGAIENAIVQTDQQPETLSLPVTLSIANGQISAGVPAAKGEAAKGEVWLCPITKDVPVTIARGENTGHTVTYHNVVRRWIKLGDWEGAAHTFTLPVGDLGDAGIDSVAVILQSGTKEAPGAMLGANVAALP